jgi:hypothetical protein
MNSATYQLSSFSGLVSHGWKAANFFVRDGEDREVTLKHRHALSAQVRSGDYFVTLATTLDSLSRDVEEHFVRARLEDIVSDLINLQDEYKIVKNDK